MQAFKPMFVLVVVGGVEIVFRAGFLAAFACSSSAHRMVFKSNLIQARWLHSPGVWLLCVRLTAALWGCWGSEKGLKIPHKLRVGGAPAPVSLALSWCWDPGCKCSGSSMQGEKNIQEEKKKVVISKCQGLYK